MVRYKIEATYWCLRQQWRPLENSKPVFEFCRSKNFDENRSHVNFFSFFYLNLERENSKTGSEFSRGCHCCLKHQYNCNSLVMEITMKITLYLPGGEHRTSRTVIFNATIETLMNCYSARQISLFLNSTVYGSPYVYF